MQGINGYYTELDKVHPPITANQSQDKRSLTSNESLRSWLKAVILETEQHWVYEELSPSVAPSLPEGTFYSHAFLY